MDTSKEDGAFLRIESVTKNFGDARAVDQVSLNVARGEIFALLGSSGCGKSTLLRMVAGFEAPSSGRIVLDGIDLAGLPPYERPVNMMFQSYALFPHLTVWDNIAFGLRRDKLPRAELASRVEEMLRLVQLGQFAKRKPHQLSGGQQQRVALARSLAKRPQLLLLDEPLAALDKKLREATQIELVNIVHQVGVTCMMVTHDQEEAMTMASRMAVMSEGRFLQVGSPADIYETPTTRFVADFIGNVNLMEGTVVMEDAEHIEIRCIDVVHRVRHGLTGYQGRSVTVAVRPEKIRLRTDKPEGEHNQVQGVVKAQSYFGDYTLYHLELPSGARLKVNVENETRQREGAPSQGDRVWAHWLPTSQVVLTQ
ncbi:polyamine ABC transporter ATP-binding protein [Variovorax soli]|uniref:Spermidine/putrescine import ATP-binding protein PotA n=1 Tax=Variovorax soli TaxID=376815 RepID=A0ABU1NNG1_9BURK|nr:polyamine ABC transporter ATP-binding protein [Variovorax soli]MDR6539561.1 putrescine transport system ATP-binding protein [Variovorax soli]